MKEWHFWGWGVKTYSDPSYIFSRGKTPNPRIYAPWLNGGSFILTVKNSVKRTKNKSNLVLSTVRPYHAHAPAAESCTCFVATAVNRHNRCLLITYVHSRTTCNKTTPARELKRTRIMLNAKLSGRRWHIHWNETMLNQQTRRNTAESLYCFFYTAWNYFELSSETKNSLWIKSRTGEDMG